MGDVALAKTVHAFLDALDKAPDSTSGLVLDIGANNGGWTREMLGRLDAHATKRRVNTTLVTFEPQPLFQRKLLALAARINNRSRTQRVPLELTCLGWQPFIQLHEHEPATHPAHSERDCRACQQAKRNAKAERGARLVGEASATSALAC